MKQKDLLGLAQASLVVALVLLAVMVIIPLPGSARPLVASSIRKSNSDRNDRLASTTRANPRESAEHSPESGEPRSTLPPAVERVANRSDRQFDAPPRPRRTALRDELPPRPVTEVEPLSPVPRDVRAPATASRKPRIELGPIEEEPTVSVGRSGPRAFSTSLSEPEDRWIHLRIVVDPGESRPTAPPAPAPAPVVVNVPPATISPVLPPAAPSPAPSVAAESLGRLEGRLEALQVQIQALSRENEILSQLNWERAARMMERNQHSTQMEGMERRIRDVETQQRERDREPPRPTPAASRSVEGRPGEAPPGTPPDSFLTPVPYGDEALVPGQGSVASPNGVTPVSAAKPGAELPPAVEPELPASPDVNTVGTATGLPLIVPGPPFHRDQRQMSLPRVPVAASQAVSEPTPSESMAPQTEERRAEMPPVEAPIAPEAPSRDPKAAEVPEPLTETEANSAPTVFEPSAIEEENPFAKPAVAPPATTPRPRMLPPQNSAEPNPLPSTPAETPTVPAEKSAEAPTANAAANGEGLAQQEAFAREKLAQAQYHRAFELLHQGNAQQARLHLKRAIELKPDLDEAQQLMQQIDAALAAPKKSRFGFPLRLGR